MAEVHLNGGPYHDSRVAIADGTTHFHIRESLSDTIARSLAQSSPEEGFIEAKTRDGVYSQCQGYPGEFEWDGWRGHDL